MGRQSGVNNDNTQGEFLDETGKTPMVKSREGEVEYETIDEFEEEQVETRGGIATVGFQQSGVPDENMLTIEEAMLGITTEGFQGGSGGTGGPLTGEWTNAGETQDLTQGTLPNGARIGGPSGGDVNGAGRNPDSFEDEVPGREQALSFGSREETEQELSRRINEQNHVELLKPQLGGE